MKKLNKKGFTLIELLAVIVIMAILVAVAIPAVTRYLDTARKGTYYDNIAAAVSAVRNDVISKSFSGSSSKMYYLNPDKLPKTGGCYTYDADANKMTEFKNGNTSLKKAECIAKNVDPRSPTYLWVDGSINDLLEKKLISSPYGSEYSASSYIMVTYTATTGTYDYKVCIVDVDKNGVKETVDTSISSESVTANSTCTLKNN